jgi:LemA protein
MKAILISIVAVIVMFVVWLMGSYNTLVNLNAQAVTQQAQVETQLQRRFELIPNLVSAVKGSMKQENEVFGLIAEARTKYAGAPDGKEKVAAANEYESAIGRLLVVMENYPELQSINRVSDLMVEIEGSENRISVARQRFNESAKDYNIVIKRFPTNMFANMLGFEQMEQFKAVDNANVAPKVEL